MNETRFWEHLKSGRFAQMVRESSRGRQISNSMVAYHILKPLFAEQEDVETVYFIFLDTKNHILAIEKMFTGSLSCAAIFPREIVKRVIALKAGAVLMAHNHPSGDPVPSGDDRAITAKVALSLLAIDVLLHDHLVIGDGYHSMSDDGLVQTAVDRCKQFLANPFQ